MAIKTHIQKQPPKQPEKDIENRVLSDVEMDPVKGGFAVTRVISRPLPQNTSRETRYP
jgi:hypothetical protein